ALETAILQRVEGDAREHAANAEDLPRERQGSIELAQLVVDRDSQRLEGALGGVSAGEANRRGDGRADHIDELARRLDRSPRAAAHNGARDPARVALLAELAQELRQAPLVPALDDLASRERLRRVHAAVRRRRGAG